MHCIFVSVSLSDLNRASKVRIGLVHLHYRHYKAAFP